MKKIIFIFLISACFVFAFDLGSFAKSVMSASSNDNGIATLGIDSSMVARGLKEALKKGVSFAANSLGKRNGYPNNSLVKIPLPENVAKKVVLCRLQRVFGADSYLLSDKD